MDLNCSCLVAGLCQVFSEPFVINMLVYFILKCDFSHVLVSTVLLMLPHILEDNCLAFVYLRSKVYFHLYFFIIIIIKEKKYLVSL